MNIFSKKISLLCRVLMVIFVISICGGCGQKGPLFIPDENEQQKQD